MLCCCGSKKFGWQESLKNNKCASTFAFTQFEFEFVCLRLYWERMHKMAVHCSVTAAEQPQVCRHLESSATCMRTSCSVVKVS